MKRAAASRTGSARVDRILLRLRGARGLDEDKLLQHALFFSKSPEERCRLSLQAARSALSLQPVIASKRASARDKDLAVLPILERTLRLSRRLKSRRQTRRAISN
jgi:hypothetical protein